MTFNYCSNLSRISGLAKVTLVVLTVAALSGGCGGAASGEVHLNQTGSTQASVTTETIPLNNCAGKANITTKAERSLDISIEGSVGVEVKVLEAKLSAKYARSQASSIELPAAPGTNMEFVVEWTEEAFFGEITVDGESGKATYHVRVPTPRVTSSVDRGCITGPYQLDRWEEAPSPITLNMEVDSGSLTIDPSGDATWTLAIQERGQHPSPQPAITCKGRFYASSQKLEGGPGGVDTNLTSNMSGFVQDLHMAFCGWNVMGGSDPFTLYPRELGGGKRMLEMRNSKGTLIWEGGDYLNTPTPAIQVGGPDLTFTGRYDFHYERTLQPAGNDLYTLVVEVSNQGKAPAQSVQVVAHSKGPGLEGDPSPLENNGYYSIAPGQTIEARFQFIFEKDFPVEYELTITVDPANAVQEENESNNQLVFMHTF